MHPAPSIILFTVLSGLGFGHLFFLGIGIPNVSGGKAFLHFLVAFSAASAGLIASCFHLGHPERALKAFTQWRTSWLSREAWLASATLSLFGIHASGIIFFGAEIEWLGALGAAMAIATVMATSMIYAQIRAVPRWNHWTTPLAFLLFALSGGAILTGESILASLFLTLSGFGLSLSWLFGDERFALRSGGLASATGLGRNGKVRAFESPHTGSNYLLREMVHVVGRKHASRLRSISMILVCVVPLASLLASGAWLSRGAFPVPLAHEIATGTALASHLCGALIARWLFFAQAEHVVGLYYGRR